MAWNAPTDQKPSDQDPWTGQAKKPSTDKPNQGPPLLEDLLKNLVKKLSGLSNKGTEPFKPKSLSQKNWMVIILLAVIIFWFFMGLFRIDRNQEALIFHWGAYQKSVGTGTHWRPWGIDRVKIFDRSKIFDQTLATDLITQDANLAHIQIRLSYHINTPKDFVLNFNHPKHIIQSIAANTLEQTAAQNKLDTILINNKNSSFNQQLQDNLANALTQQKLGIQLDQVIVSNIAVPDALTGTLDKINALYDEQNKQRQQAVDYESQHLPDATAKADTEIAHAKTYAEQAKIKAVQDVADFLAIFPVYKKDPALTRYRLYNDMMKEVLSQTTKVVVDEKITGAVVNLAGSNATTTPAAVTSTPAAIQSKASDDSPSDERYGDVKGGY